MSFSTSVKDELSWVKPDCDTCSIAKNHKSNINCQLCAKAKLSALVQSKGILKFHGQGKYSVEISTDSASVARFAIKDLHDLYDLDTNLVLRKNVLNNTSNCLIELLQGQKLIDALCDMGILEDQNTSLQNKNTLQNKQYKTSKKETQTKQKDSSVDALQTVKIRNGIKKDFMKNNHCAAAYLRGVFLGSGYVSEPSGSFHFEIAVGNLHQAEDIVEILSKKDIKAGVYNRRGLYMVYIKSGQGIADFLAFTGAYKSAMNLENVRVVKSVRNHENRQINFEMANLARSSQAAVDQLNLIKTVASHYGVRNLPPALQQFIKLRIQHPTASLADLGNYANPPLSKSAINSRIRRLKQMKEKI